MDPTDLAAVAIFVKVVELQNFRAAAQALKVPRSTVSARVAGLEERLGARLLERSTRAMRLTAAGAAFHAQVAPAVEAVAAAEHAVTDLETAPSGELRVTVPIETGQQALGPVIAAYMQRYPDVKVHLELVGTAYGVKTEGGLLDFVTREVEVECLPTEIPHEIKVDVSDVKIGEHLEVKHIVMPEGVTLLEDPDRVVVSVAHAKLEVEAPAAAPAEGAEAAAPAEPEVIAKGKKEEEKEKAS